MKLNNIHSRKDFVKKVNEADSISAGPSGFSNNLSLKDTYLGKLMNGMFRSAAWLWRKSKEDFVINKLIGRLVNELMRGVVVYCFDRNINLKTGVVATADANVQDAQKESGVKSEIKKLLEFEPIRKDAEANFGSPDNPSPDVLKTIFGVNIKLENIAKIKDPDEFDRVVQEMEDFLSQNVDNYSKIPDTAAGKLQKEKIQKIYMNYKISQILKEKARINEEKLKAEKAKAKTTVQSQTESLLNEALVTAKPLHDPRAGEDASGKIADNPIIVGDILTKRDRDKYKEHADELALNIHDINLAEIEKTVQTTKDQDAVATFVNPENLKTIQMTAEELFIPTRESLFDNPKSENEKGDPEKDRLKLKWKKELTNTYASFTDIMTIDKVDIRNMKFREDLAGNVKDRVGEEKSKVINAKQTAEVSEKFGDILGKNISASELIGYWSFMSFVYKNNSFMSSMANIKNLTTLDTDKKLYFFQVANTFSLPIDENAHTVTSTLLEFKKIFAQNNTNNTVYFMFRNPHFPTGKNIPIVQSILVFINAKNTNDLFLCKFTPDGNRVESTINITDAITSEQIDKCKVKITISEHKIFEDNVNIWGESLKLTTDNDFRTDKVPSFLKNDPSLKDKLIEICKNFKKN